LNNERSGKTGSGKAENPDLLSRLEKPDIRSGVGLLMTRVTKSVRMIFWIGLIAGTLDITENIVFNAFRGITPWRIFQFIASGLIDGRSFQLGWASVVLGVVIHYAIALAWTAILVISATRFTVLSRRPILSGL